MGGLAAAGARAGDQPGAVVMVQGVWFYGVRLVSVRVPSYFATLGAVGSGMVL